MVKKLVTVTALSLMLAACSNTEKASEPAKEETIQETTDTTETATTDQSSSSDQQALVGEIPIFPSTDMEEKFKTLVGDDYDIFAATFEMIMEVPIAEDGLHAYSGLIDGLQGIAEAIIVYDDKGNIWAATTEDDNINIYHSDKTAKTKMSPVVEGWTQNFKGHTLVFKD